MSDTPPAGSPNSREQRLTQPPTTPPQPSFQANPQSVPPQIAALLAQARGQLPYGPGIGIQPPGQLMLPFGLPQVQIWQGQFPPPEAVERFEAVNPGAFNRMIQMAEQAQASQIDSVARAMTFAHNDSRRSHWLGFCSTIAAILGAIFCVIWGAQWIAALFLSVPVMAVGKALIEGASKTPQSSAPQQSVVQQAAGEPTVSP